MRDFGEQEKPGFFARLKQGLSRSAGGLSDNLTGLFTKKRLDAETISDLEEALIRADMGAVQAAKLSQAVARGRFDAEISDQELRRVLARAIAEVLAPASHPLTIDKDKKPFVVLVAGVNGTGKTTTIGKMAGKYARDGFKVMLAAGDTFRAAAIEQLQIWGKRANVPVVSKEAGADAAGLAYEALQRAQAEKLDLLFIDTAGRLQNKTGLMAELEKIVRVIQKLDSTAPHAVLLVLDATTGQNALSQVEAFNQAVPLTGLVMTKLDGTAKGGILVALAAKFGLPVHFIGVGEGEEDLQVFDADTFAQALTGAA